METKLAKLLPAFLGVILLTGIPVALAEEVVIDMDRIMQIESGGNYMAYNRHSQARGLFQITPICLKDFNMVNKTHYLSFDLFNPQVNIRIAHWYMNERIPALLKGIAPDTVDNRLWAYNAGVGALKRNSMPKETRDYIKKYHKED